MSRINYRIFLAGILSFFFFFSFFQSSQAGFFDWFKWFRKNNLQNTTEVVPSVKKASSSSSLSKNSNSSKSSQSFSKVSNPKPSSSIAYSVESMNDWKIYRNEEYGFEFKYPVGWNATLNLNYTEGTNYKVIARVVNPARAGKPDTDVPIEMFLVRSLNYPCKGKTTSLTGRAGTDTGWDEGFGNIYHRMLCIKIEGWPIVWPITISLSAFDQPSQAIMERILSTFKFIEFKNKVCDVYVQLVLDMGILPSEAKYSDDKKVFVFIHSDRELSDDEIKVVESSGAKINKESWIPPLQNHPTGFYISSVKLGNVCKLSKAPFIKKVNSAMRKLEFQYE